MTGLNGHYCTHYCELQLIWNLYNINRYKNIFNKKRHYDLTKKEENEYEWMNSLMPAFCFSCSVPFGQIIVTFFIENVFVSYLDIFLFLSYMFMLY